MTTSRMREHLQQAGQLEAPDQLQPLPADEGTLEYDHHEEDRWDPEAEIVSPPPPPRPKHNRRKVARG